MIRSDLNSPDYLEVKDSSSLQEFGKRFLSTPGAKAQLKSREFINLLPGEVLAKTGEIESSATLEGISSKFQYICKVKNLILLLRYLIFVSIFRLMELFSGGDIPVSVFHVSSKTGTTVARTILLAS